jgi:hypothetical protein
MISILMSLACSYTIRGQAVDIDNQCTFTVQRDIPGSERLDCVDSWEVWGIDDEGHCLRFNSVCFDADNQPWLSGCDALAGCCEALEQSLPTCAEIAVTPPS